MESQNAGNKRSEEQIAYPMLGRLVPSPHRPMLNIEEVRLSARIFNETFEVGEKVEVFWNDQFGRTHWVSGEIEKLATVSGGVASVMLKDQGWYGIHTIQKISND